MIFFLPKRLSDFFVPRGCVFFYPERLRDLFVLRGFVTFISVPIGCLIFFCPGWGFFLSNEVA